MFYGVGSKREVGAFAAVGATAGASVPIVVAAVAFAAADAAAFAAAAAAASDLACFRPPLFCHVYMYRSLRCLLRVSHVLNRPTPPCLRAFQQLLTKFEDYVDEHNVTNGGAVVGYDGFHANASVRDLLNSLCKEVRAVHVTTLAAV